MHDVTMGSLFALTTERQAQLDVAVRRLAKDECRITSTAFFDEAEVQILRDLALAQKFRTAQTEIKHKSRSVFQDFAVCFPAPRVGAFDTVANLLEIGLSRAGAGLAPSPFEGPICLEDFAIQHYPAGSRGIGIHRDGLRYRQIVVIITLEGESRLFSCDDREGTNKQPIDDQPGRIVLLSAAGFAGREGEDARPLHGVDQVTGGRLSIGFRCAPTPPLPTA